MSAPERLAPYPPAMERRRRGGLADEVAVYIRGLILTGVLRPGERIDQEAVSSALAVSRSPIREALVVLGQEGLLELTPHRGACVARITPDDIAEHYELFGAISGRAAALAATHLGDDHIAELEAVHRRFRTGTPAEQTAANHEFHRIINHVASRRTRWMLALLAKSVPKDYYEFADGAYQDAVADHEAILSAIVARDPAGAQQAMEHHLHEGGRAAAETLRRRGFWDGSP